jgi:uncharacterized membrane protein
MGAMDADKPRAAVASGPPAARLAVLAAALAGAMFLAGAWLGPLLAEAGVPGASWLRLAYGPLCHQLPERCLGLAGTSAALCARCTGLYLGGLAGLLLAVARLPAGLRGLRPSLLGWAVAPTAIDAVLAWLGAPALPDLPRLLVAVPAGLVAGLFLALGIADWWTMPRKFSRFRCGSEPHIPFAGGSR